MTVTCRISVPKPSLNPTRCVSLMRRLCIVLDEPVILVLDNSTFWPVGRRIWSKGSPRACPPNSLICTITDRHCLVYLCIIQIYITKMVSRHRRTPTKENNRHHFARPPSSNHSHPSISDPTDSIDSVPTTFYPSTSINYHRSAMGAPPLLSSIYYRGVFPRFGSSHPWNEY